MSDCLKPLGTLTFGPPTVAAAHRYCFEALDGVVHRLALMRVTPDQALLQYVNAEGQLAPFPPGFALISLAAEPALCLDGQFVLACAASYDLTLHGAVIMKIRSQRHQALFGHAGVQRGHTLRPLPNLGVLISVVAAEEVVID